MPKKIRIKQKPKKYESILRQANSQYLEGRYHEAAGMYKEALEGIGRRADILNGLGMALRQLGRTQEAMEAYGGALELMPNSPQIINNLANLHKDTGMYQEAIGLYKRAISLNPSYADAYLNMGAAYHLAGMHDDAVKAYQSALSVRPTFLEAICNLGELYQEIGLPDDARRCYLEASAISPGNEMLKLRADNVSPVIMQGETDMLFWRQAFSESIDRHKVVDLSAHLSDAVRFNAHAPFYMQYQGEDDLLLRTRYASLFTAPKLNPHKSGSAGRKRVGFLVTGEHSGMFLRINRGIVEHWALEGTDLYIVCDQSNKAVLKSAITRQDIGYLTMPPNANNAISEISDFRFDAIYYFECGTDALNYFIPFFRPSPFQFTSWGTTVTTGVPDMDVYLSSELFEAQDAASHYSERLVMLKTIPAYFYRPEMPQNPKDRAGFGLSDGKTVYVCQQSLFKVHPDFDQLMASILRACPDSIILLPEGRRPMWTSLIKERFNKTMPDLMDRIIFHPRMSYADYMNLLGVCDVMLDTVNFGGGSTVIEASYAGLPCITQPKRFLRSRAAYACYKKMGIMDTVAKDEADYVAKAHKLASDNDYRLALSKSIKAASEVLFEDMDAVRGFEKAVSEGVF